MDAKATDEIVCEISGGGLQENVLHRVRVNYDGNDSPQSLSSLSERLAELKELVNRSLTELVDKEKKLVPSGNQMLDVEAEDEDSSEPGG